MADQDVNFRKYNNIIKYRQHEKDNQIQLQITTRMENFKFGEQAQKGISKHIF